MKTLKQVAYAIGVSLILLSCGNKFEGQIETRPGNKIYLVNQSGSKEYKFTLKTTKVTNNSTYDYNTQIIELAPGDEILIGHKNEVSAIEYTEKEEQVFIIDSMERENMHLAIRDKLNNTSDNEFKKAFLASVKGDIDIKGKDTIINGKHLKYHYSFIRIKDTLNPLPVNRYEYNYEVTGQLEIKNNKGNITNKN